MDLLPEEELLRKAVDADVSGYDRIDDLYDAWLFSRMHYFIAKHLIAEGKLAGNLFSMWAAARVCSLFCIQRPVLQLQELIFRLNPSLRLRENLNILRTLSETYSCILLLLLFAGTMLV